MAAAKKKTPGASAARLGTAAKVTPQGVAFAAGEKAGTSIRKASEPKGRLTSANPKRLLLGEFLVCFIILGVGTIVAPTDRAGGVPRLMLKGTALAALFLILALISSGGAKAMKLASGLGGLVAITYVFTSSDAVNVFKWMNEFFSNPSISQGAAAQAGASDLAAGITNTSDLNDQGQYPSGQFGAIGTAGRIFQGDVQTWEQAAGAGRGGSSLIGGILDSGSQGSGIAPTPGRPVAE